MNGFKLEQISLFQGLGAAEIKFISNFLIAKDYKQGDKVFQKNTVRDKLVIITDGSVKLQTEVAGHIEDIALFKEGDFLGEMAFLEKDSKHKHELIVSSPRLQTSELAVYNWFTILKKHPAIADKIHKNIAINLKGRLDHANNKLVTLFASGKIIATYDNLTDISANIIRAILKVIPVHKALFITYSETTQKLIVQHVLGYQKIKNNAVYNLNDDPLLKKLITEPQTMVFNKNNWPEDYINLPYTSNSLIVAPIKVGKKVSGFIILGDKLNNRNFSDNNKILLEAIATQTAPAIEDVWLSNLQASAEDLEKVYIDPFAT